MDGIKINVPRNMEDRMAYSGYKISPRLFSMILNTWSSVAQSKIT